MIEKKFKRNLLYRARKVNNRDVIISGGQCFELNEIALTIWNNLNGENSLDDLIVIISKEYDVELETLKKDVIRFITSMVEERAIQEA